MLNRPLDACIIGAGYIGLPTAALAANSGLKIQLCDINPDIVDTINSGKIHIVEQGLNEIVKSTVESYQLNAATEIPSRVPIYIVCVPTPLLFDDLTSVRRADLSYVVNVIEKLAQILVGDEVIILESTSPVGTSKKILKMIYKLRPDLKNIKLAYCPERVLPGKILSELISNDRIVGCEGHECFSAVERFYRNFVTGDIRVTSIETAEFVKLAENTYRDINIAIANEFSMMCDRAKVNTNEMIELANLHPRVNILKPGIGVGGHCLAIDPWFLVEQFNSCAELTSAARNVNTSKTQYCTGQVKLRAEELGLSRKAKIGLYGASYKPDIDDFRESPSIIIAQELLLVDYKVFFIEPNGEVPGYSNISLTEAFNECDLVVVLVGHSHLNYNLKEFEKNFFKVIDFTGML